MSAPAAPLALGYRPEIDGLRALAVLAVVIFHARLGVLEGGYAGVDVFFVISGFLISRLIAMEWQRTGGFSLAGFYERRIRRLFPALVMMVLASALAGWLLLPPAELVGLARSAFAALAFFSNLHFAREVGYFQPRAETQPLLHTWSLGVEEQFYILAPFVILALLRLPLRWRRAVLGTLALASLGYAVAVALRQSEGGFFWPGTRAHELLIGVALGLRLVPLPTGERARALMATTGLGVVALALALLPTGVLFPSWLALIPCLGTALVIGASEGGAIPGLAGAGLRAAPMRFFGKISYSLYLWHWPALVYAEMAGEGTPALRLGALVLAVLVSWLSWRFVETPLRHGAGEQRVLRVFVPALVVLLAGFGFARLVSAQQGFAQRFAPGLAQTLAAMNEPPAGGPACRMGQPCTLGDAQGKLTTLIWGDSHAAMFTGPLHAGLLARGERGVLLSDGGCPPLVNEDGVQVLERLNCRRVAERALALARENPGLAVVLAARWAFYAEASLFGPGERGKRFRQLAPGGAEANRAAFRRALEATAKHLAATGAQVRLIGPVPEFETDVLRHATRVLMRGQVPAVSLPRATFEARQHAVLEALRAQAGARVVLVHEALCDATACRGTLEGVPLYTDNNHLSPRGVSLVRPALAGAMP